jgi:glycosyltransferase involved in cell wall biosynthesis
VPRPNIIYIQYTNPAGYPPLIHSSRILADAGLDVLFLGTTPAGTETLRMNDHPRITVRNIPFCTRGWRQKLHYLKFNLWVLSTLFHFRPQCVYASDYLVAPVAWLARILPCIKVIYHEHDSPQEQNGSSFSKSLMLMRRRLAQTAEVCVLPNAQRAELFKRSTKTSRTVLCVWNCPSRSEVAERVGDRSSEKFTMFYHGSIVPTRLPIAVLDALTLLPNSVSLRFAGYETAGHRNYVAKLLTHARALGINDRVTYIGTPQREELLSECSKASAGLALFPKSTSDLNEQTMVGASNKAFEFMASGLALIVCDLPDFRKTFVDSGVGVACDPADAVSIASAVRSLMTNQESLHQMQQRARQKIADEWNYETQFRPVAAMIHDFVAARSTS